MRAAEASTRTQMAAPPTLTESVQLSQIHAILVWVCFVQMV